MNDSLKPALRIPLSGWLILDKPRGLGSTQGVSNRLVGESATIRIASGILLVAQESGE